MLSSYQVVRYRVTAGARVDMLLSATECQQTVHVTRHRRSASMHSHNLACAEEARSE